jgi:hypothetical protein
MQQHFGVGVIGAPPVFAQRLELGSNIRMIVDLAVEDERDRPFVVHHRLRGVGREIDNRQAPVTERAAPIGRAPQARPVRAAVRHLVAHARDDISA